MDKYIGAMLDNRYEILEAIGSGGMAVVYKARCHRLNRFVAVKILKEEFAQDADFRRRFHAESQAVAMLSHPNIVAVYDVSRSADTEYIVMELIDGITMKQYMQRKGVPLSWRETLHFVTQITKALGHAHGRGIIHRDIKPHNIMILRDGSVKVADFGIARLTSMQNTLTQETLGSVHYISPEQARGSHIDARSDLYSVGVVMYEMLTGRLPFEGDSAVSVAIQHINSMPLSPREINPGVPEALEIITMKAMSPSLSRRYSSAEAMLSDMEEFRKNPNVVFAYTMGDLREKSEEPTRSLQAAPTRDSSISQRSASAIAPSLNASHLPDHEAAEEEDYRQRTRNSKMTILVGALAVLIFVGGLVWLLVTILPSLFPDNDKPQVEVPDFIGLNYVDVTRKHAARTDYTDFFIEKAGEDYSADYAEGVIMDQDPKDKDMVDKGTTIRMTVSKGPHMVDVPYCENKEFSQARDELEMRGFKVFPKTELNDEIPLNYVIMTEPKGGETVPEGTQVTVVISLGTNAVEIPNLYNKSYEDAEAELDALKLITKKAEEASDHVEVGRVTRTDPPAGDRQEMGTIVHVYVSTGPATKYVTVPSYLGTMQSELASKVLGDKLTVGDIDPEVSDKPVGEVIWQSITAGSSVAETTTIHFRVSAGNPTTPPPDTPPPTPTATPPPPPPTDLFVNKSITVPMPSWAGETVNIVVTVGGAIYYSDPTYISASGPFVRVVGGHMDDQVTVFIDGIIEFSKQLKDIP